MEPSDLSIQKFVFQSGFIRYQNTPWDTQALGKKSISIIDLESSKNKFQSLLTAFIDKCRVDHIKFCSIRIPASNTQLKDTLQLLGFRAVEHTLDVQTTSFNRNKAEDLLSRIPVSTTNDIDKHVLKVESIAQEAFQFGRFHEDPKINLALASQRNKNWIKNLVSQQASFNILIKKEKVLGFMAWKSDEKNNTSLLFGGVLENYQHLSYSFWADTLSKLANSDSISTTISSSNTPVLNLYSYFGFHFTNPQFGFHLHM